MGSSIEKTNLLWMVFKESQKNLSPFLDKILFPISPRRKTADDTIVIGSGIIHYIIFNKYSYTWLQFKNEDKEKIEKVIIDWNFLEM